MRSLRITVDALMTLLLLLQMAYEMVGPALEALCVPLGIPIDGYALGPFLHEAAGAAFILLIGLHLWLNRRWLMGMFKGRYTAARAVLVFFDLLLIADVAFLLVSGVLMSKVLDLPFEGGMDFARTAHLLAAYWGFAVMSAHIGLHLRRIPQWAMIPMCYGVYAFLKRQLWEYMSLRSQFVFFDFEEPIARFFLDYAAIMLLFAGLGHYLMALCRRMEEKR